MADTFKKLPRTVRVLGRTYRIIVSAKCPWNDYELGTPHFGAVNWDKGRIWIEKGRHIDIQRDALFHEVFETVLHDFMTIEPDDDIGERVFKFNHQKFQDISTVLFATLRDNKVI